MAVKPLQSLTRALDVIETVAAHQPVGVAELARITGEDKSALQRVLVTLHASGWIRPSGEQVTRWELTARPFVVVGQARRRNGLLTRARPVMEHLREATGETVTLAVPDSGRVVAVDVVESHHLVRSAPRVGMVFPSATSAAGLALCAAVAPADIDLVDVDLRDERFLAELEVTRRQGWSLNAGKVHSDATSVAAAVLDAAGHPVAALIVSAPSDRLVPDEQARAGALVARAAADLGEHAAD